MRHTLIDKEIQPIFARGDDVESTGFEDVGDCKMDATPFTATNRTVVDDLLHKTFAVPFEVIEADIIPFAGIIAIVGTMTFAGDKLITSVAINVNPV